MSFNHIHCHTEFSLLDGLCKIDQLVQHVVALNQTAVAMTDHGNMAGYVKFVAACQKAKIKPIVGVEQYIAPDHKAKQRRNHHVILLARNTAGFKNLVRLNSMSHLQGFYYFPRIDLPMLRDHREGIIALSACLGGELAECYRDGGYERMRAVALTYRDALEPGAYFLETQPNGMRDQLDLNRALERLSNDINVPLVATCDCHYLRKADATAQDTLMAIQTRSSKSDKERLTHGEMHALYLWSEGELRQRGGLHPSAIDNAGYIADMIDANAVPKAKPLLPNAAGSFAELADEAHRGLVRARLRARPEADYHARLEHELAIIERTSFAGYFLVVQDFVRAARERGIPVGPGRGSGAGSLVARVLGITGLDPLEHGLMFERFLNPERVSMPDFDIDFCENRRAEVIEYLCDKYGRDAVGGISNYAQFRGKSVIRDVLKVHGSDHAGAVALVKDAPGLLPETQKAPTVAWLAKHHEPLVQRAREDDALARALAEATQIEGSFRSRGIHASGVVIAPGPLQEYAPACRGKGNEGLACQLDMNDCEKAGLIKFDVLGLSTLTLLDQCKRFTGVDWETDVRTDDHAVYQLISKADTYGVFQLGSTGMRRMLRELAPSEFRHVDAAVALFRPGPLQGGMVKDFIERRHGRAPVEHLHPALASVTADTYGVIVYQEQVMAACQVLAGYSLGEADVVRRIMGKKKKEEVEPARERFMERADAHGLVSAEEARNVWFLLEKFSGYGFNRAHSCAYALLAYYTAWYKTHHLAAFFAAVANLEGDKGRDELARALHEARASGLTISPPDINAAGVGFTPVGRTGLLCGLTAVKGLGMTTAGKVVAERTSGTYRDTTHLRKRTGISAAVCVSLAKAGAFDALAPSRGQAIAAAGLDTLARQGDLFGPRSAWPAPAKIPLSRLDVLRGEREAVGVYLTGHPLDGVPGATSIASMTEDAKDGDKITLRVLVLDYETKDTRNGKEYAVLQVEDETGSCEVLAWPRAWGQAWSAVQEAHKADTAVALRVVLRAEQSSEESDDVRWKVELDSATTLAAVETEQRVKEWVLISLPAGALPQVVAQIGSICRAWPGTLPVQVKMGDETAHLDLRVSAGVVDDVGWRSLGVVVKVVSES